MAAATLATAIAWLAAAACAGAGPARPDLNPIVDREIARLEATAGGIDPGSLPESAATDLAADPEALAAVRTTRSLELRLYQLAEPFVGIETLDFLARNRDAGGSIDALERLWTAHRPDFAALPAAADGSLPSALLETAVTRADRLFHASLQYGRISSPPDGLYYLAQAEGNRRFAELLAAAAPARPGPPAPEPAALRAAADRLETEALHAMEGGAGFRDLIPVNVRLDEAREMVEAGRPAGAALQLLEAKLRLSRFASAPPPAGGGTQEAPAVPPDDERRANAVAEGDSVAALLRAMADEPGDADRARIARAALIPLYAALHEEPPAAERGAARTVTLTLVRWPYT